MDAKYLNEAMIILGFQLKAEDIENVIINSNL
jgi:hypothetical protein